MRIFLHKNKLASAFQKGYTLLELLIYMGIFSTVIVVLTNVFSQILDLQLESKSTSSVETDGGFILARLMYDLNQVQGGSNLLIPASLGQTASTLQFVSNSVNYTYSLDGSNNLILTNNTSGTSDMLNSYDTQITSVSFQRLGNTGGRNSIQVVFTIASRTTRSSGPETRSYQTTVATR